MKNTVSFILIMFTLMNISGCAPLIIGSAVGALGGYAVSRDTVEGATDTEYDRLWNAVTTVSRIRGTIKSEDYARGYLNAEIEANKVWIKLLRLTKTTTRLRVSARKYHLPNLSLAEDLFVKITEEAK